MQKQLKEQIFSKYNIDLSSIRVENIPSLPREEKELIVYCLLYAFELAKKNRRAGNATGSSYSCCIIDSELEPHFGINFNATRNETSSICAERLALLEAFADKIKEFDYQNDEFDFKIKYILMNSYEENGDYTLKKVTPCADCLSWFNTGYHLGADTSFVSLKRDDNGLYLYFQKLEDFLPLRNLSFEIIEPEKCKQVVNLTDFKIDEKLALELYKKTYECYKKNDLALTSGQNTAAGVVSNNVIFTGAKIDFSKRWFVDPLETAFLSAINKFGNNAKLDMICYVGEEYTLTECGKNIKDGLISLKMLGRLLTKFANKDTFIVTAAKNGIEIRTIGDFLPGDCTFVQGYKIK